MNEDLLDRLARYQAEVEQLQRKWGITLEEMAARYNAVGVEDFESDDDYLQWRWFAEAIVSVQGKLGESGSNQEAAGSS